MKDENHYLKLCLKDAYENRDKTCAYTLCMNWILKDALKLIEQQEEIIKKLKEQKEEK